MCADSQTTQSVLQRRQSDTSSNRRVTQAATNTVLLTEDMCDKWYIIPFDGQCSNQRGDTASTMHSNPQGSNVNATMQEIGMPQPKESG